MRQILLISFSGKQKLCAKVSTIALGLLFYQWNLLGSVQDLGEDYLVSGLLLSAGQLREKHLDREALDTYLHILEIAPDHFEALCGASYLYGELGKRFKEKKQQREFYEKALELAKRSFQQAPEHPESNLVMAWAYGGIALISESGEKVEAGKKVKKHIDLVLENRPEDDRAWYILANLNYTVGTASFLQKAFAKVLFGGVPRNMTVEAAIEAYRKAVEIKPDYILYRYELTRALLREGSEEEARQHLRRALQSEPQTEDDPALLEECQKLLRKLEN